MAEHSRLIQSDPISFPELKQTLADALKMQEAAQATVASQNARISQQEARINQACHLLDMHCVRLECCAAHADFPHKTLSVGC